MKLFFSVLLILLAATSVFAAQVSLPTLTVFITGSGVVAAPNHITGGCYLLTIKNNNKQDSGIVMYGMDKVGDLTTRYTSILKTGKSETFRWYFAKGTGVVIQGLKSFSSVQSSILRASYGSQKGVLSVQ